MSNKTYDILKWAVITVMPALTTCFSTIGVALGWEFTEIVIIIVGALTTCLGTIIGISSNNYNKNREE